ncbi:MAG TPA: hypothetical protein VGP47_04145 [Parachlamydiaceae bacterium]|nr:hypothetical protein [Parachlamydiaceae bacterium]
MNSISNITSIPQVQPCSVSAWLSPGHAFVDFNCKGLHRTIGFYPSSLDESINLHLLETISGVGVSSAAQYVIGGGSSSLFDALSGKGISSGSTFHLLNGQENAFLRDDSYLLDQCLNREIPCMVKHLNVSFDVFEKAWNEMIEIKNEMDLNIEDKCPLAPTDRYLYHAIHNNCVDFMRRILDSTGICNWKRDLEFTYLPSRMDKLTAVAWHYFNWT